MGCSWADSSRDRNSRAIPGMDVRISGWCSKCRELPQMNGAGGSGGGVVPAAAQCGGDDRTDLGVGEVGGLEPAWDAAFGEDPADADVLGADGAGGVALTPYVARSNPSWAHKENTHEPPRGWQPCE